jgi:hypothetical protein
MEGFSSGRTFAAASTGSQFEKVHGFILSLFFCGVQKCFIYGQQNFLFRDGEQQITC